MTVDSYLFIHVRFPNHLCCPLTMSWGVVVSHYSYHLFIVQKLQLKSSQDLIFEKILNFPALFHQKWAPFWQAADKSCLLCPWGCFRNTYELFNLRALKIWTLYRNSIFQCIGKIFCVEFKRCPLKFHTKYLNHTLKDVHFIHRWKFKSS